MSAENKTIEIEPDINTDAEQQPDVCLSLKGLDTEVTLPNLNSADLPIELVNVVLIVKSKVVLSEEETFHATACPPSAMRTVSWCWSRAASSSAAVTTS